MNKIISLLQPASRQYLVIIWAVLVMMPINLACSQIIVGYLPMWKEYNLNYMDFNAYNVLKLSFLDIQDGKVVFPPQYKERFIKNINKLHKLKQQQPNLKLIISVGGWGVSGFSNAAYTKKNRVKLATSIAKILKNYQLDGVDIDWEFPVHGGGGIKSRDEDKENLTLLLKELRTQLNILAIQEHKKYYISIAIAAAPWVPTTINFKEILWYADYIGVMSYNLAGNWSAITGHHAPLFQHDSNWATSDIVKVLLKEGVLPKQIIFGVPFYGRYLANVANKNKGFHQSFKGNGGIASLSYGNIKERYLTNPDFKKYYDKKAKADFLYSAKEKAFITYMGTQSATEVAKYVKKQQLLGVMVWEVTQDSQQQDLTKVFYKELHKQDSNYSIIQILSTAFK